ncbi:hypothetical protein RZV17_04205 [Xanthomonas cannabis]|uniref:hypothetical protein n=1 Tax=Xanthomonas cannabis TaxID=1885674 RepID=UPI0033BD5932
MRSKTWSFRSIHVAAKFVSIVTWRMSDQTAHRMTKRSKRRLQNEKRLRARKAAEAMFACNGLMHATMSRSALHNLGTLRERALCAVCGLVQRRHIRAPRAGSVNV